MQHRLMPGHANPGAIVVVNGASSSGKTSTVRAFQDLMEKPFLDAGLDRFLFMLPHRYLERPLWSDVLGQNVRSGTTGDRLMRGMHRAIAALAVDGLDVIVDHVLVERAWVRDLADLLGPLGGYLIGLNCPLEVLVERERSRKDRTLGQAADQFDVVHRHTRYDLELDTSALTPINCAEMIRDRLARPPEAFSLLGTGPPGR